MQQTAAALNWTDDPKRAMALAIGQAQILEQIATSQPLPAVLEAIARLTEAQADGLLCSILLLDAERRRLRHGAAPSLPEAYNHAIDGIEIGPAVGSCGTAAFTGRPVIVPDVQADPRWADFLELAAAHDLRACWSTPIVGRSGQVLGTFAMYYRQVRDPGPADERLLATATHLVRIALDRECAEQDRLALAREQVARAEADRQRGQLEHLFAQAPAAVAILEGAQHTFTFANTAYLALVGRRPVVGKSIREALPELQGQGIYELLDQVYTSGQAYVGDELPVRLDTGTGLADRFFNFVYQPTRGANGQMSGIFVHAVDVTPHVVARRQLETLATNTSLALFIMDEHQRCTFMNPAAEQLTGYSLAEVQAAPLHSYIHHLRPDGTPYPLEDCPIDRALPSDIREQGEEVFVHKDGWFYPVAFTASPIREGGRTVGTIIEVEEISARKRAQAEANEHTVLTAFQAAVGLALTQGGGLQAGLQRCTEAMVRHLDAAFARIWTLNQATQVLELQASAGLYTHLNGPHGRVPVGQLKIGLIAHERTPHLTNQVVGDPRVGEQEWARREGMVAFAGYPLVVEDTVVGVMGMFARHALSPATLEAMATVANAVGLAIERARAEAAAEAERALLRDLLTNAPAIIGLYRGPEHVLEFANPMLLRNVGDRDVLGRPVREMFPELEGQGLFELLDRVYSTGEPFVGNEVHVKSDRGIDGVTQDSFFNFVYQPIRGSSGTVEAILVHAVDVTEQVQARQRVESLAAELASANRELEAFSYSVSHDLRAPLRAMDGFSRILLEEYADGLPDDARRYLRLVRDNAGQMARLIDDLLTFSRLSRQELVRRPVDPAAIARQVVQDLAAMSAGRRVDVRIAELPSTQADPSLLRQVYANLLGNALKFTRERDTAVIEVGAMEHDGETVYTVRDNGVGFDMRYSDKLFGVFQRLHRAEEYEGTGVGLAIVQRIVHRHGGRVWGESAPGQGATFFFTLEGQNQQ